LVRPTYDLSRLKARGRGSQTSGTIVFVHAGLTNADAWRPSAAACAERTGMEALAYDRDGYGATDPIPTFAPDFLEHEATKLESLLDSLGRGRVHLVGHSDGATIALLVASRRPELALSLTLIGVHTFVESVTLNSIQELADQCAAGHIPRWLSRSHGARAGRLAGAWSAAWLDARRRQWDVRPMLHPRAQVVPMLIIQGSEDEYGTERQVTTLTDLYPVAVTWLVPGAGHAPHLEIGDRFVDRLAAHLVAAREPNGRTG